MVIVTSRSVGAPRAKLSDDGRVSVLAEGVHISLDIREAADLAAEISAITTAATEANLTRLLAILADKGDVK